MAFVIDASVTLAWCFEDEVTSSTDRLLFSLQSGDIATVPSHWPLEVLNGLLYAVRRQRISNEKVTRFWGDLTALPIHIVPVNLNECPAIYDLAAQHGLTIYDAACLHLAHSTGLPLATLDSELRNAATADGLHLVDLQR